LEFPEVHDWHIEATASALNGAVASTDYRDAVAAFDKAFDGHMGWNCNSSKSNTVDGIDPDSGVVVSLFNPRRQAWYDHFKGIDHSRKYSERQLLGVRLLPGST
jgi:hypothetical protein